MTWGTRIEVFLPQLTPIPMLHLGIGGGPGAASGGEDHDAADRERPGRRVPRVHLNKAINGFGSLVYVRPMAEMNSAKALYNSSNGAGFSPQWYRLAFARIYLILHGGPRVKIDVALKRLGLPYLTVHEDLPANPKGKLKVIWNPVAGHGGWQLFYPGNKWVDLSATTCTAWAATSRAAANEELYAFARAHRKRYSFPEWGMAVDQPEFVRYICDFIKGKAAIELAAYFDSKAGSKWDLGPKSNSKQAYRSCLTPLELSRIATPRPARARVRARWRPSGAHRRRRLPAPRRGRGSSSGSSSRRSAWRDPAPRRC